VFLIDSVPATPSRQQITSAGSLASLWPPRIKLKIHDATLERQRGRYRSATYLKPGGGRTGPKA